MAIETTTILDTTQQLFGILGFLLFVMLRKEIMIGIKRRFFTGKGYAYIRMWMPDRHESEDFVNLRKEPFMIMGRAYVIDVERGTFRPDISEDERNDIEKKNAFLRLVQQVVFKINPAKKEEFEEKVRFWKKIEQYSRTLGKGEYGLDLKSVTYKGKYPVFNYRWDRAEPIDPYDLDAGTDPEKLANILKRAKAQNSLAEIFNQNKKLIMYILIIAGAAGVAAYFGYENNQILQQCVGRGPAL